MNDITTAEVMDLTRMLAARRAALVKEKAAIKTTLEEALLYIESKGWDAWMLDEELGKSGPVLRHIKRLENEIDLLKYWLRERTSELV